MRKFIKKFIIKYLENQAKRLISNYRPKIVAVVGSVGKTSTKLAIAKVLTEKYAVLAHMSSYNSPISLPLSMFNLRVPEQLYNPLAWLWLLTKINFKHRFSYPYEVIVLELGTDRPGDIAEFMSYIKPQVGVLTAITPEHMEGFGSMEAVVEEEFELAKHAKFILINASDVLLRIKSKELDSKKVLSFGVDKGDYWFQIGKVGFEGIQGILHLPPKRNIHLNTRVISKQTLYSLSAAAAVADYFKLNDSEIENGLEKVKPIYGRMNPLRGINNSIIIDDTYNSSPDAAAAALDALYMLPGKRKIAILGSMNELGTYSKEGHENVGRWCGNLDFLIVVGQEAKKYLLPEAIKSGLSKTKVKTFLSPYKAGFYAAKMLKSGDIVLVKGSQNAIFLEETTKVLLANPSDIDKLVRQSKFWQRIKIKQFGPEAGV